MAFGRIFAGSTGVVFANAESVGPAVVAIVRSLLAIVGNVLFVAVYVGFDFVELLGESGDGLDKITGGIGELLMLGR